MKTLVTGGAGFIGSHVAERLLKEGHEVIILDDLSLGKIKNIEYLKTISDKLEFHKKSILDKDIKELFNNVDVVFHLAALPRVQFSIQNPEITHKANVEGTFNLLNICKDKKVKRFVFTSSSSIYGDQDILPLKETMKPNPMSPYALHKLIGELYCKVFYEIYGLETVSLRYFNVYGPRQDPEGGYACLIPKFILKLKNNEKVVINGDGLQTRDFTFVTDVVNANLLAGFSSDKRILGESFNIGGGRNVSVNEVTNEIVRLCNSKSLIEHGPGVIEPKDTLAGVSKALELLKWKPEVSFEDGLKKTFESLR